jgi:hypothetical protein
MRSHIHLSKGYERIINANRIRGGSIFRNGC